MERLVHLLTSSLSHYIAPEIREKETDELLSLYKEARTIFNCFDIIGSDFPDPVRCSAAISLKQTLQHSIPDSLDRVKSEIVRVLKSERSARVATCVLASVDRVIALCIEEWPELRDFVIGLPREMTVRPGVVLEVTLAYIYHCSCDAVSADLASFLTPSQFAFGGSSFVVKGLEVLSAVAIRLVDVRRLLGPWDVAAGEIKKAVRTDESMSFGMMRPLREMARNGKCFLPPNAFIDFLFGLLPGCLGNGVVVAICGTIDVVLECFGQELAERSDEIAKKIIDTGASVFEDGRGLGAQGDLMFVVDSLRWVLNVCDAIGVFGMILSSVDETGPVAKTVAVSAAVLVCIDARPYDLMDRMTSNVGFLWGQMQTRNVCIREITIEIVRVILHFAVVESEYAKELRSMFFESLFNLLFDENDIVVIKAVKTIGQAMRVGTMQGRMIAPIFRKLQEVRAEKDFGVYMMEAMLSWGIATNGKVGGNNGLLWTFVGTSFNSTDTVIQAIAIRSAWCLLQNAGGMNRVTNSWKLVSRFRRAKAFNVRESVAYVLTECTKSSDFDDIVEKNRDDVSKFIVDGFEDVKCDITEDNTIFMGQLFALLKTVAKRHMNILPRDLGEMYKTCLSAMIDGTPTLAESATRCAYRLADRIDPDFSDLLGVLGLCLNDQEVVIRRICLKLAIRFVRRGIHLPKVISERAITILQSSNDNATRDAGLGLMIEMASKNDHDFPEAQYNTLKKLSSNVVDLPHFLRMIHVLLESSKCPKVSKKEMIGDLVKGIASGDSRQLLVAVDALEYVFETDPEAMRSWFQPLMRHLGEVYGKANRPPAERAEPSLSLALSAVAAGATTDIDDLLDRILVQRFRCCGDTILSKLVKLYQKKVAQIDTFPKKLIDIFVGVIVHPDDEFRDMKLAEATVRDMIMAIRALEKVDPSHVEMASTSIFDEETHERFKARMAKV